MSMELLNPFFLALEAHPVIASVRDIDEMNYVLKAPVKVVFILKGNILNLKERVQLLSKFDKTVIIHFDLLDGLSKDALALEYIVKEVKPYGIITTRPDIIRKAKEMGLFAIQRIFMLDSLAYESGIRSVENAKPDAIEIIPGVIPDVIETFYRITKIPIVTGGLVRSKNDVIKAIDAGAIGVSSSSHKVWNM